MKFRLGTMGFSYSDWVGGFYPKSIKSNEWLSFYAKHFNAVELDTTFHAVPPRERVQRWRDETPDEFRFTAKVPKSITHESSLDRRAVEDMLDFLRTMWSFREKLGVVLLQFPPSFSMNESRPLQSFLRLMPADKVPFRFAVEFRHASWFDSIRQTSALLGELNVALVSAEYVSEPRAITPTTDFLYIRWIGEHDRFIEMDREQIDPTARLIAWKEQVDSIATAGAVNATYGFFNNDYAGYSIATCNRFKRLIGEPVVEVVDPRQGELFG